MHARCRYCSSWMTQSWLLMECNIEVKEHSAESIEEVVYLGVEFSADGRMEGELDRRIGIAKSAVGAMQKHAGKLSKKAKVEVYNECN